SSAHLPGYHDNLLPGPVIEIGTFTATLDENNTDVSNLGKVNWSFSIADTDPVLQSLAAGETITQTYTVTIDDQHAGGSVSQDVVVTLTGTNDVPTIQSSPGDHPNLTEDSGPDPLKASGTITFQDLDLIDTHLFPSLLTSDLSSAHLPGYHDNLLP